MYELINDNQDYNYEDAWEATTEQIYPFCEDCRLMLAYSASLTVSKEHLIKLRNAIDKLLKDPDFEPEFSWEPQETHTSGSCLSVSN